MDGILLVDKPIGWTSHDVVAKVRGILRKELSTNHYSLATSATKLRVGHSGTLDPLATGLLVLLIGNYTKKASEFSKLDKTYEATIKLGETSTTGDEQGEKTAVSSKQPAVSEVEEALKSFVGEIQQTPHAFSAVKVGGKRAYKLARAGKEVKIEPRKVTIYQIQNTKYKYPFASFTAKVSSGTYIRSLAEDIGQKLGAGAYLTALKRTEVGDFLLNDAVSIDKAPGKTLLHIRQK